MFEFGQDRIVRGNKLAEGEVMGWGEDMGFLDIWL